MAQGTAPGHTTMLLVSQRGRSRGSAELRGPAQALQLLPTTPQNSGKEESSLSLLRSPGHRAGGTGHKELRFPLSCTNHKPFLPRGPSWLPVPGRIHDTRAEGPLPRLGQHLTVLPVARRWRRDVAAAQALIPGGPLAGSCVALQWRPR